MQLEKLGSGYYMGTKSSELSIIYMARKARSLALDGSKSLELGIIWLEKLVARPHMAQKDQS